jgi:dipeptidyl aminopeptidase/acylaminoacyl peptidase
MFQFNCRFSLTTYSVEADGTDLRRLGAFGYHGGYGDSSDDVIISLWRSDQSLDAFRLNTATGRTKSLVLGAPHGAQWLVFDHHRRLRALSALSSDGKRVSMWYRRDLGSDWVSLEERDLTDARTLPVGFSEDDQVLYVVARDGEDTSALFAYDVAQRRVTDKLVAIDGFDVEGSLIYSDQTQQLLGIRVVGDRPRTFWINRLFATAQTSIDAALPDTVNELRGEPGGPLLVFAHSDTRPGRHYLFDAGRRRLEELADDRPWIRTESLSTMQSIRYPARDGLSIPAYLTLPKGRQAAKLPLIALIHDGPFEHDQWGYDAQVQFLASRGYAVLQPNFRGSTGYGFRLFQAGWRVWGLAMQDDVADGVEYLAAQGLVDRQRVCIMGAGYGGYAALMGLVREPGTYRCAIDFGGWTDLKRLFHTGFYYEHTSIRRYALKELVGDLDTMSRQFELTSPLHEQAHIKAPVLLAYGDRNAAVPITDGAMLRDALEARHADYRWLTMPGEARSLQKEENRFLYFEEVEQFLLKYNPPDWSLP